MSETLFIRLTGQATDPIFWLVWSDSENEIIASGQLNHKDELSSLTNHAQSRQVLALASGLDVTLKTITLPGKFNKQLQSAAPYIIEEELAGDVDNLFFAFGDKVEVDGKPAVNAAIVDRDTMDNWLSWFEEADIPVTRMIPDVLCVPPSEEAWTCVDLDEQWIVRTGEWEAAIVEQQWFDHFLQLAASQSEERIVLKSYSPLNITADVDVESLPAELPLKLLAEQSKDISFNLLQGEYTRKKTGSKYWNIWKNAAIVAGVALLLNLGLKGFELWQLDSQLSAAQDSMIADYKKAFPGEKRVRKSLIKRNLKKKLEALGGGESAAGFLVMMDDLSMAFAQNRQFKPTGIRYDGKRNEIRLQASADGFQTFEKFKSSVEKAGFDVQQGSLNSDEGTVVGSLTIRSSS